MLEPPWLTVLRAKVAETSAAEVSRLLVGNNSKRPAISLILSGKYSADPKSVRALVQARLMNVACPFTQGEMTQNECRGHALRRAPVHNPMAMQHWRACQRCEHRPEQHEEK